MRRLSVPGWIRSSACALVLVLSLSGQTTPVAFPSRDLTVGERIVAQQAIDAVYRRHQDGPQGPIERDRARRLAEEKVRRYLKQSAALSRYWHTPVTGTMLRAELGRIAASTRFPQRLTEIYAALGYDTFLIEECFARPVLVDRLARSFQSFDPAIQQASRREAEELREQLTGGRIPFRSDHPLRVGVRRIDRVDIAPGDGVPVHPGEVGALIESRNAFKVRVAVDADPRTITIATYAIPKLSWDTWWGRVRSGLDERNIGAVARNDSLPPPLPRPGRRGAAGTAVFERLGGGAAPEGDFCIPDDTWDPSALEESPDQREGHSAVWTGSYMVIWGGRAGSYVDTGSRYDPLIDQWQPTSRLDAPAPRQWHTAVWSGSEMLIWGGIGDGGGIDQWLNSGGRYDPVADTWIAMSSANAPEGRADHTAVWTGTEMIVWGGIRPGPIRTGGRYNPSSDSWSATTQTLAPSARSGHTAIWSGARMVVWGGYDGAYLATGGRYDPATNSWNPTWSDPEFGTPPPAGRRDHTAVWTGTEMIIWGGYDGTYLDTGSRYDPIGDTWNDTNLPAPVNRSGHTAIWTGTQMVVWGGTRGGGMDLNFGGRYDPASDSWLGVSTVDAPDPRADHTAVWTGDLMIVWGGTAGPGGGRYDPATDSWTPTSRGSAPDGRWRHTAIWTGTRTIVWGGEDADQFMNSGGLYDPLLDSWTPTPLTGAPSERSLHSAVWTGEQMIIWGGSVPGDLFNTGGRYDPLGDTWLPTSMVDAPTPRTGHTAVWTGTRMIIWGGGGTNPGGRYDPATDTWEIVSMVGEPSPRSEHTATWTGAQMVIWGGIDSNMNLLDTGGRYDPASDSWLPMAGGAPLARRYHSAVWTGDRVLIWGGSDPGPLGSGGIYDPASDTWSATPLTGAPTARFHHSAIWTGDRMVLWGGIQEDGSGGTELADDGGRYDPSAISPAWDPVSLLNAPSRRYGHTAVWTGDFMLVWGGRGPDPVYPRNGGRYALGQIVDADGDGVAACEGDCDDIDPTIYPGAGEICDDRDNNCDGTIDEGFVPDGDGDGVKICEGDCDDSTGAVYPGAPAFCDGLNNDCNDPSWPAIDGTNESDEDGDGFSECQNDCDDADPVIYAEAPELNDGLDNQCPGDIGYGVIDETSGNSGFHNPADQNEYSWTSQAGASRYEINRSSRPDFAGPCTGVTQSGTVWNDPDLPGLGECYFYLNRPFKPKTGSWGQSSSGLERTGICL